MLQIIHLKKGGITWSKLQNFYIKHTKEKLKIAVVIGPEGGLEKEEVLALEKAGARVVSLGKRILRTETVALQVASIILYELEEWEE